MDILDPTSSSGSSDLDSLSPRIDELNGKCIGLYDNGKMAAEPVLMVLEKKLDDRYDNITFNSFSLNEKSEVQDPDNQAQINNWADSEIDVCIGAIGDCGSCTKYLTWGIQIVESAGVPAVGLIDEGFELDWQSNAIERGMALRYTKDAVRSEVRDTNLIAERLTSEALDNIEDELTRPLTEKEQGSAST